MAEDVSFMSLLGTTAKDTAMGAKVGTMIAPGVGTAIGAGSGALLGLITGGVQAGQAHKNKVAANGLAPDLYDPTSLAMLDEVQQKRKSLLSGSAYAGQMGEIDAITAGTNEAIIQASGGDSGGTIQALLNAQSNAGRAKNQVLGQSGQEGQFYSTLAADMQNRISSRAMELKLAASAQNRAEWAQNSQDSFGNAAAGYAKTDAGSFDFMDLLKRHGAPKNIPDVGNNGMDFNPMPSNPGAVPQAIPEMSSLLSLTA